MADDDQPRRPFTMRAISRPTIAYTIALSIIASLATVVWITTIALVSAQGKVAAEVNVAGRQRMLSQKIALLTSELGASTPSRRVDLRDEIVACADLLERAHGIMLSRDIDLLRVTAAEGTQCRPGSIEPPPRGYASEALEAAYFAGAVSLDALIGHYASLVREVANNPNLSADNYRRAQAAIFAVAREDLPQRFDRVVQTIQREGEAQVSRLVALKTAMWVITLVLLGLEILLIFRPMVRQIEEKIQSIKEMALALAERHRSELELRQANDSKTRFLAHMSHELRTPLNAIIGFAQMLVAGDTLRVSRTRRDEYARHIESSGEHLLQLVNDLLDLSRVELNTVSVKKTHVDVGRVVSGVAAMMRLRAAQNDQRILIDQPAVSVAALADERLLRQVLVNLVDNALKYGEVGGEVRIGFAQVTQDVVEIVVEDTGIGFDMADLPFLLEPFSRAETDPTIAPDGVGLGLPLSKRLVEAQGGVLEIVSSIGVGTRAVVTLSSVESAFAQRRAC